MVRGYVMDMGQSVGELFSEIQGPGVRLVEALTRLEDKLRDMGLEVNYKVQSEDKVFSWEEIGKP